MLEEWSKDRQKDDEFPNIGSYLKPCRCPGSNWKLCLELLDSKPTDHSVGVSARLTLLVSPFFVYKPNISYQQHSSV